MSNVNKDNIDAEAIVAAVEAGAAWARGLKIGDKFMGSRPEAETRYQDKTLQRMFMYGALDVLGKGRVCTDMNGILIEDVVRNGNCGFCGEPYDVHRAASGNSAPFCTARASRPGDTFIREGK